MVAEQTKSINVYRAHEFVHLLNKEGYYLHGYDIYDYYQVDKTEIHSICIDRCNYIGINLWFKDFGKTWFLNEEEAMRAADRLTKQRRSKHGSRTK